MALVLANRVRETTTTTGTGTVTLAGAVTGYQSFSAIGNANTTYYCIAGQGTSEWEVGLGTYTSSGTTLSRDTVLASSNSGSLVSFSAGTKDVFVTYPSNKSVYLDASGNVVLTGALTATSINFGGSTLSSYISSSYTGTLTGVTTTVTGTVYYVKVGDQVTIDTPYNAMTGTSNATTKTITGMPAAIRPASTKRWFAIVQDNGGVALAGEFFLYSTGVLDFYTNLNAAGFTASGTATVFQLCYTYTVN